MNVLLVGSSGSLMKNIITRLHKEGHRIFLLSDSKSDKKRPRYVFERYCFDYNSESIPQVFESVRPDVTLYLGAQDSGTVIRNETESVRFFSGLMTMLVSFSMGHRGRFVYLSTSDIFAGTDGSLIEEEDLPLCDSPRSLALAQAEEICQSYRSRLDLDVVVLRLDNLYAIPSKREEVNTPCARMCLDAFENHAVTWTAGDTFSMLYEADAVEFIHRILFCKSHREGIYNLSSSVPVTEEELAQYIEELGMGELTLRQRAGTGKMRILSNKRYREEFGMRLFSDAKKMTQGTLLYMQENAKAFRKTKPRKESLLVRIGKKLSWLGWVLLPYIENMICFVPFFMLNNRAVGSQYFDRLDFYLLYVLLFAIVYGQQQATFSAILATAGYCFRQMYTMSRFEIFSSYNTYVWLAQLFIVGMVVGYMRDKLREQAIESEEEQSYLTNRISDIFDINRSNVRVKDSLRTQIINQNNSVGKVYEITSSLDQYMPEEVLFYAAQIMSKLMETKDVAVYMVSNRDYARLFSYTSEQAKSMGRSIRYRETGDMFDTLNRHQVFINRKLDQSLPMMANAIFEGDNMQIIVMAWGIPWEAMTLGQANLMSVVSALIQEAVLRAGRYMAALEDQRYEQDGQILNKEAFSSLARAFIKAREEGLTDCTFLKYDAEDALGRVKEIRSALRQSDYMGTLEDGAVYLLLSNTGAEDAHFVLERMEAKGLKLSIVEGLFL